ncbi:hypothetical protein LJR219_000480 [Phenylobacterium sp. LjRoot219]|uniref:hypothetical protein n=1 Tax=Phenylobacterium sp. LjRoot219 TaxID=3342283 RepID=UPI003ED05832
MNDVRKLMDTLRGDVEYREFNAPVAPAARAGGWALLDRLDRAAPKSAAVVVEPIVAEELPEPEPVLAAQMREAAAARSTRGMGGLRLGKYVAPTTQAAVASADDARKLPLEAVFARLAQGAR